MLKVLLDPPDRIIYLPLPTRAAAAPDAGNVNRMSSVPEKLLSHRSDWSSSVSCSNRSHHFLQWQQICEVSESCGCKKKKKKQQPVPREKKNQFGLKKKKARQFRSLKEHANGFSNFTVCSVWSAATSLICRRHFASVCGPASRWALWNPAELFHHFHQSNIVCSHLCRCEHRFFTFQHFTSDLLPEIPSQTRNVSPRRVTSWCLCKLLIRQRAVLRSNSLTFTALS